jgi:hypothetical protein
MLFVRDVQRFEPVALRISVAFVVPGPAAASLVPWGAGVEATTDGVTGPLPVGHGRGDGAR